MKKRIYLAKANHKTANHENQTNASGEKQNHQLTGQGKSSCLKSPEASFIALSVTSMWKIWNRAILYA